MQFAFLAQSPREMALTDRILPRYFLSRVRVAIRPRLFLYAKKPQAKPARGPVATVACFSATDRQNGAIWNADYTFTPGGDLRPRRAAMDDFVGAHAKPPQSKKKLSALQRSSQARQRMRSIREEATAPGANTPLTLQVGLGKNCER